MTTFNRPSTSLSIYSIRSAFYDAQSIEGGHLVRRLIAQKKSDFERVSLAEELLKDEDDVLAEYR